MTTRHLQSDNLHSLSMKGWSPGGCIPHGVFGMVLRRLILYMLKTTHLPSDFSSLRISLFHCLVSLRMSRYHDCKEFSCLEW